MRQALVDRLRTLPAGEREAILARCSTRELASLRWCWREFWARPDERDPTDPRLGRGQLPPDGIPWTWWCLIGGRGSGKTEAAARWVTEQAMRLGKGCRFTLVAPSLDDGRHVMIDGESGLAQAAPPWAGFEFRSSVEGGLVTWRSGAVAHLFGADKPRKGRGPQCNRMWIDDPAAFGPAGKATVDQLLWGFRLRAPDGSEPQGVVSSTPIDSELLDFFLDAAEDRGKRKSNIVYSFSTTDDNRRNLAESFYRETIAEFAGTELEAQERYGQRIKQRSGKPFAGIALNVPPVRVGALPHDIIAIAVWIDPATSSASYSCEVGVVVVALDARGHVYGAEDLSKVMSSTEWPDVALEAAERWSTVAPTHLGIEIQIGGEMGPGLLQQTEKLRRVQRGLPGVVTFEIKIAKVGNKGKAQRAVPVARLAKAGQFHLLPGLDALETQLRALDETGTGKLDRADALVHGVNDLAMGAYVVGGAQMPAGPFGPAPVGSVNVGPVMGVSPTQGQALAFQFGIPAGGWGR